MKIYVLPMLLSLSLNAPLFAADAPPPPELPKTPEAKVAPKTEAQATISAPVEQAKAEAAPAAAPSVKTATNADNSYESLQKARAAHMQAMHERMAKIWATENPKVRQKLMEEHQQAMQNFRTEMQGMMQKIMQKRMSGYGHGWRQGMHPGSGYGMQRHQGKAHHRGNMMHQKHAEIEKRLDNIEAMIKQLAEKQ